MLIIKIIPSLLQNSAYLGSYAFDSRSRRMYGEITRWEATWRRFVETGILDCRHVREIAKTINFVMSVCSSVSPNGTTRLPLDEFSWNLSIFRNSVEKIQVSFKSDKIKNTSHEDQHTFLIISRSFLLRTRNVSDESCGETRNTHFVFSNFLFRKSWRLWVNVEQCCRTAQATDDNMAHAHCVLDN